MVEQVHDPRRNTPGRGNVDAKYLFNSVVDSRVRRSSPPDARASNGLSMSGLTARMSNVLTGRGLRGEQQLLRE